MGTLYQQKNAYGDKGDPVVTLPVIEGYGYVTKVLAGSSQRTTCDAIVGLKCENPQLCQPQFCQRQPPAYHLTNIVGEPVEFPLLEDSAQFSVEALPNSAQVIKRERGLVHIVCTLLTRGSIGDVSLLYPAWTTISRLLPACHQYAVPDE
jgi:hypothetical protein